MQFLLNSQPKHTYFLHSTNTFTEAQTHLKVSIGFWSSVTRWPSCQCVVEKCSSAMVWRSHPLCASTFWSATATGQPMLLVSHRHWPANATGQPMLLVSHHHWSANATGQPPSLASQCYWSANATGQPPPLVSQCYWSATATGQPILMVSHRHWSANTTGLPLSIHHQPGATMLATRTFPMSNSRQQEEESKTQDTRSRHTSMISTT